MAKPKNPKKLNGATVAASVEASAPITAAEVSAPTPPTTEPKPSTRRPTIIRSEARANLVPINVEEEIRKLAYLLSERRGFVPGHENEDWLAAESEVRQRYHQQSA